MSARRYRQGESINEIWTRLSTIDRLASVSCLIWGTMFMLVAVTSL